jgi:prepilin-type N-terminal cleavage/methylation domain-containing protein
MIRLGKRVGAGFTLVEMLVVIVIISILAALISTAAASAMWTAKQHKIKMELDMLAGAMEAFHQKYNSYPPTNLSMLQDMSGNYYANPQLNAFVARAFPRYTALSGNTIPQQIALDLSNAGVDITEFNPQVALVFWLSGFGPDPTDPFNRANATVSRSSFFSFFQTQLMAWQAGATSLSPATVSPTGTAYQYGGTTRYDSLSPPSYGIGQMVYNAPYGNAAYCYFDNQSYGQPISSSTSVYGDVAGASNTGTTYAIFGTTSASLPQELIGSSAAAVPAGLYNGTGIVMPYLFDANGNGVFDSTESFCKPTSFQIISAGQDGAFGTVSLPASGHQGRLYPTGLNYDVPPPAGGSGDDDNLTNFCEKSSLESAKP